jgi:hypothetical protein
LDASPLFLEMLKLEKLEIPSTINETNQQAYDRQGF